MKLAFNIRSIRHLRVSSLYIKALFVLVVATLFYCTFRFALMIPDPTPSDDTLATRGTHVNTASYEAFTKYRDQLSKRSSSTLTTFREPM